MDITAVLSLPNFRAWFGDSKAVNAQGQPLVVYHGTRLVFDTFDMSRSRDGAHFFTESADHAASFGPAAAFLLRIENPMEISQDDLDTAWDCDHPDGHQGDSALLPRHYVVDFVQKAKAAGHDGLIIRQMGDRDVEVDMFLPFGPGQIKSADRNGGAFDRNNPSVTS